MSLSIPLPDFLAQSPDGEIRVAGHRIGLYHVLTRYNEGDSAEMLAARYPTLPLALVHKVLAFYLENQAPVDAYLASCASASERQRDEARSLDVAALRRRLVQNQPVAPEAHVG